MAPEMNDTQQWRVVAFEHPNRSQIRRRRCNVWIYCNIDRSRCCQTATSESCRGRLRELRLRNVECRHSGELATVLRIGEGGAVDRRVVVPDQLRDATDVQ